MRILAVIPHYFGSAAGSGSFCSTIPANFVRRRDSLHKTIASLHQHFGRQQHLLLHGGETRPVNQILANDLDIMVCVTGSHHLLKELELPSGSFQVREFSIENPRFLGYSCYDVLREACGRYDWYCYLEDDIVISDPLFFCKLQAFYNAIGDARYLLQPNRYELGTGSELSKAYIDGPLWSDSAAFLADMRLPGCCDEIPVGFGDITFRTTPALNPHSGCFFLTNVHLQHMLEQPWYGERVVGYAGPLESAATQYIITLFHVFKPALECASFLEVHHSCQRIIKPSMHPAANHHNPPEERAGHGR